MSTVSVIIVNWNGRKFLPECLEGLRQQQYAPLSIILVDNGSHDASIDFVSDNYPDVRIISLPENTGFSVANNIALKTVETEYVALLNNDAVPDPLWLKNLVDGLKAHPEAGFAASKMLFYDNPNIIDRAGDAYTRSGAALLRGRGNKVDEYNDQEWVFGACAGAALYRMAMFNDIGLFDEEFFLLYEDVDLSFRAQLKGYQCLYVPEAFVYHKGSSTIVRDSAISVYYGHRNLEWVYIKNMPSRLIYRTMIQHIAYNIAALSYFLLCGRGKDFLRAKKDALRGIKGALRKRKQIQGGKVVDDRYLWGLFERTKLMERLTGRLRINVHDYSGGGQDEK